MMSPPLHINQLHSPHMSPLDSLDDAATSLTPGVLTMSKCNTNLKKLNEHRSHIKLLDNIPSIPLTVAPVDAPITTLSTSKLQEDEDNNASRVCTLFMCWNLKF